LSDRLEYAPVEKHHDDAGDVEGTHRGEDDVVRVVEDADVRCERPAFGVVYAEYDG